MKTFLTKIKGNIFHLPSTVSGVAIALATWILAHSALFQQLGSLDPKAAKFATGVVGLASSILLIFGTGPDPK